MNPAIGIRSDNKVVSIQYLRGIAACLVLFAHASEQFPLDGIRLLHDVAWNGVDLFFVISGFVMTYTVAARPYRREEFFLRRLARIAPLYWLVTFAVALLAWLAPNLLKTTQFSWPSLIASLLFVPWFDPSGVISPMLHLGWTLNYEMLFYAVFALVLYLPPLNRTLVLAMVFYALITLVNAIPFHFAPWMFYGHGVTLEFVAGCLIGTAYVRGWVTRMSMNAALVALLLGLFATFYFAYVHGEDEGRLFWKGLPAALLVLSVLALEQRRPLHSAVLHKIGDASYSIYLTHLFLVMAVRKLWLVAQLPTTGWMTNVYVAIAVVGGILMGMVVYEKVETRLVEVAKFRRFRLVFQSA